jgi:hypothetical protein
MIIETSREFSNASASIPFSKQFRAKLMELTGEKEKEDGSRNRRRHGTSKF